MTEHQGGEQEDPDLRRRVALGCAATFLLLAWGLWAFWPYILDEHRRLEPWKVPLHWAGDGVALFWFLHFVARHFVAGEPLATRRLHEGERAPRGWAVAATLVVAGLADFGVTAWHLREETAGYERARATTAELIAVKQNQAVDRIHYRLRCRFADEAGAAHETVVEASRRKGRAWPAAIDRTLAAALDANDVPRSVQIRYAPEWPERAWLEGQPGWENSFGYLTLMVLAIQAGTYLLLMTLTAASRSALAAAGRVAWWSDLHRPLPLVGEALVLGLFGTIHVAMGWRG